MVPDPALVDTCCFGLTLPLNNPGISREFAQTVGRSIRGFDIVHIHAIWNFPTWWTMRAAYRARVPYIVAPQGSLDPWALRQNALGKRVYGAVTEVPLLRRAACLQALTEKEVLQFREFGLTTASKIIPNGIGSHLIEKTWAPNPEFFGLPPSCKTLLFLSRIHPKKGIDLLIDAVAGVREKIPDVRLVIAGGDAGTGYLDEIRLRSDRRGLAGVVVFLGEVEDERKFEALSAADAFVLPSYSEGLPVAALEALGCGLPAIVTRECNLPEIAERGAGYVVEPHVAAIRTAISRLFSLARRERNSMGRRARELARDKFTWPGIAESALECYRELVHARNVR